MGDIISLAEYKKEKGIAAPRSPYYPLNATRAEIQAALERAAEYMSAPMNGDGLMPYAVLIGYEDQNGRVKLLKENCIYPSKEMFEQDAGRKNMKTIALVAQN